MSSQPVRELRVARSTVVATGNNPVLSQLLSLMKLVDAASIKLSEAELMKSLTSGQAAVYSVNQLEMAVNNGGYESFFRYRGGDVVNAAQRGLVLVNATKFAANLAAATKLLPWKRGWPERDAREEALDELLEREPEVFDDVDTQFQACYDGVESLGAALVAYAFAHPSDFFIDAEA